jgi:type I restriction enzyme S subunit
LRQKPLKDGWRKVKLKEVCREITVGHVGSMAKEYVDEGIPFLRSQNILPFSLELSSVKYITPEFHGKLKKSALLPGDVAVVRTGYPGIACVIPSKPSICNCADLVIIRPSEELNAKYLTCVFNSTWGQGIIAGTLVGVAQQHFNVSAAKEMEVNLPPRHTQDKIAAIIYNYNDLIENNTRRIEILEEMARSLYREWFVKFRFPGHEQVQTVDSELGLIPEGWKLKKLDELGSIGRGKSKHRPRNDPSLYGGDYPFVQTGEVKEALLYITHYSQTYNEKGLAQSKLWEPKTLLLTIAANIAETAILKIPACFPDSIVGFVADSEQVTPEFIKFRIDDIKEKMQSFSRGTAQDNLSLDKIKLFYFLVPDKDYIIIFDKYTAPLFSQVQNLLLKNANLRQTRDLLLPKLISGEIDVENLDINTGPIAA